MVELHREGSTPAACAVVKYVHDQLLEMEFYNSLFVNMVQSTFQWLNHIGPRHNKLDKYFFSQEECYIQNIKITTKLFKNILLLICLLYPCEITLCQKKFFNNYIWTLQNFY